MAVLAGHLGLSPQGDGTDGAALCDRREDWMWGSVTRIEAQRYPGDHAQVVLVVKAAHSWLDGETFFFHRLMPFRLVMDVEGGRTREIPLGVEEYSTTWMGFPTGMLVGTIPTRPPSWNPPRGFLESPNIIPSDPDGVLHLDRDDARRFAPFAEFREQYPDGRLLVVRFDMPKSARTIIEQNFENLIRCLGLNPEQVVRQANRYVVVRPSAEQYLHTVELCLREFDHARWNKMLWMTVEARSFTNITDLVVVSKYSLEWGLALDYEEPNRGCRRQTILFADSHGERYDSLLRMHLQQDPTVSCTFRKELNVPSSGIEPILKID